MTTAAPCPPLEALPERLNIPRVCGEATLLLLSGDHWGPWLDAALRTAETSIYLSVYMASHHWRAHRKGDLNLLETLAAAARRGLQCRAILGNPSTRHTQEDYNHDAGAKLIQAGWRIRAFTGPRVLHEKTILIDRRISLIGSHNLSRSSATSNYDTSLAVESAALGEALFAQFWRRWRDAHPIA